MGPILFPLGVRLSTWLCVLAFAALAARRRDVLPLVAAWVWLIGFEAAFDAFGLAVDGYAADRVLPLVIGVFTLGWCARTRILRLSLPWATATVLAWTVWLALGLHWNSYYTPETDFRWGSELFNEVAKTTWALAYLTPLLALDRRSANTTLRGAYATRAAWSEPPV